MDPLNGFKIKMGNLVGPETYNLSFPEVVVLSAIQLKGINVTISSIGENNCTGTVSLSADFGRISGDMSEVPDGPPMPYSEPSDIPDPGQSTDPIPSAYGFELSAYSINASGEIVFNINKDSFTIQSVALNAANGTPTVLSCDQSDSQLLAQVFETTIIRTRFQSTTILGKLIPAIASALQES